ncbi:hypothetical protein Pelo_11891 [Pelomyxa schiedti]|nr:hypothetical protein Pelo_11891 [Pelomyxa schiedti]
MVSLDYFFSPLSRGFFFGIYVSRNFMTTFLPGSTGFIAFALTLSSLSILSLFTVFTISFLGERLSWLCGVVCMASFIGSLLTKKPEIVIPMAVPLGFALALLYNTQSTFVVRCATRETTGRVQGIFWSVATLGAVLAGLMTAEIDRAGHSLSTTFTIALFLLITPLVLIIFLPTHDEMPFTGFFKTNLSCASCTQAKSQCNSTARSWLGLPVEQEHSSLPYNNRKCSFSAVQDRLKAIIKQILSFEMLLLCPSMVYIGVNSSYFGGKITPIMGAKWGGYVWTTYNVIRTLASFPAGLLADKYGRIPLVIATWILITIAYGTVMTFQIPGTTPGIFFVCIVSLAFAETGLWNGCLAPCLGCCADSDSAFGAYRVLWPLGAAVAFFIAPYIDYRVLGACFWSLGTLACVCFFILELRKRRAPTTHVPLKEEDTAPSTSTETQQPANEVPMVSFPSPPLAPRMPTSSRTREARLLCPPNTGLREDDSSNDEGLEGKQISKSDHDALFADAISGQAKRESTPPPPLESAEANPKSPPLDKSEDNSAHNHNRPRPRPHHHNNKQLEQRRTHRRQRATMTSQERTATVYFLEEQLMKLLQLQNQPGDQNHEAIPSHTTNHLLPPSQLQHNTVLQPVEASSLPENDGLFNNTEPDICTKTPQGQDQHQVSQEMHRHIQVDKLRPEIEESQPLFLPEGSPPLSPSLQAVSGNVAGSESKRKALMQLLLAPPGSPVDSDSQTAVVSPDLRAKPQPTTLTEAPHAKATNVESPTLSSASMESTVSTTFSLDTLSTSSTSSENDLSEIPSISNSPSICDQVNNSGSDGSAFDDSALGATSRSGVWKHGVSPKLSGGPITRSWSASDLVRYDSQAPLSPPPRILSHSFHESADDLTQLLPPLHTATCSETPSKVLNSCTEVAHDLDSTPITSQNGPQIVRSVSPLPSQLTVKTMQQKKPATLPRRKSGSLLNALVRNPKPNQTKLHEIELVKTWVQSLKAIPADGLTLDIFVSHFEKILGSENHPLFPFFSPAVLAFTKSLYQSPELGSDKTATLIRQNATALCDHIIDVALDKWYSDLFDLDVWIERALWEVLFELNYKSLWNRYCKKFSVEDEEFKVSCSKLHDITTKSLGISRRFCLAVPSPFLLAQDGPGNYTPYQDPINEIKLLDTMETPWLKLSCIVKVGALIVATVEQHWGDQLPPDQLNIGADDFLPLVSFVLIKGNLEHAFTTFKYIEHFIREEDLAGEAAYILTTFQTSLCLVSALLTTKEGPIGEPLTSIPEQCYTPFPEEPTTSAKDTPENEITPSELSPEKSDHDQAVPKCTNSEIVPVLSTNEEIPPPRDLDYIPPPKEPIEFIPPPKEPQIDYIPPPKDSNADDIPPPQVDRISASKDSAVNDIPPPKSPPPLIDSSKSSASTYIRGSRPPPLPRTPTPGRAHLILPPTLRGSRMSQPMSAQMSQIITSRCSVSNLAYFTNKPPLAPSRPPPERLLLNSLSLPDKPSTPPKSPSNVPLEPPPTVVPPGASSAPLLDRIAPSEVPSTPPSIQQASLLLAAKLAFSEAPVHATAHPIAPSRAPPVTLSPAQPLGAPLPSTLSNPPNSNSKPSPEITVPGRKCAISDSPPLSTATMAKGSRTCAPLMPSVKPPALPPQLKSAIHANPYGANRRPTVGSLTPISPVLAPSYPPYPPSPAPLPNAIPSSSATPPIESTPPPQTIILSSVIHTQLPPQSTPSTKERPIDTQPSRTPPPPQPPPPQPQQTSLYVTVICSSPSPPVIIHSPPSTPAPSPQKQTQTQTPALVHSALASPATIRHAPSTQAPLPPTSTTTTTTTTTTATSVLISVPSNPSLSQGAPITVSVLQELPPPPSTPAPTLPPASKQSDSLVAPDSSSTTKL